MRNLFYVLCLLLVLTLCCHSHASSKDLEKDVRSGAGYKEALDILETSDRGNLQKKTDKAIHNLITATVGELKKRGHNALAYKIETDYNHRYKGFIYSIKPGMRDVGSHEALQWLLFIHDDIHAVLTDSICRAIRTHDLWTLAYTIPVVFGCPDGIDFPEYGKHFTPLLGITVYWISYGSCAFLSMGTGIIYVCGAISMVTEAATTNVIAPVTVSSAHKAACQ